MATPQEALFGNQGSIYPFAGYNILFGTPHTSSGTLDVSEWLVYADTTAGPFSLLLPAVPYEGQSYKFVDNAPAGSFAANNLTINGNGKTINGAATLVLSTNFASYELRYNGTNWIIFNKAP
jgi:hypothetical protein